MTPNVFQIRDAANTNEEEIRRLVAEACSSALAFRGAQRLRDACAGLDLTAPKGLVGCHDARNVGLALWTIARQELILEVLYVDPVARGLGLGESLVRGAIERARATGCRSISGRALPGDRETKNVYERTGLVSQVITVGRDLD